MQRQPNCYRQQMLGATPRGQAAEAAIFSRPPGQAARRSRGLAFPECAVRRERAGDCRPESRRRAGPRSWLQYFQSRPSRPGSRHTARSTAASPCRSGPATGSAPMTGTGVFAVTPARCAAPPFRDQPQAPALGLWRRIRAPDRACDGPEGPRLEGTAGRSAARHMAHGLPVDGDPDDADQWFHGSILA